MKLFEQYISVEELMEHLRTVAKNIAQNLTFLPKEVGGKFTWDNFRVVIKRLSSSNDFIKFLEVEVYFDDKHIGNINIDFKSEAPYILVAYDINSVNEGNDYHQSNEKLLA